MTHIDAECSELVKNLPLANDGRVRKAPRSYRAQIEKLFAQHPDHDLFGSLPGAGPKIAPRLLGEIGSDRSRFEDPSALQCLAGTAPVSYQSGQIHKVYLRRHCKQAAPPRCAFLGQPESAILSVGRCLLRAAPHTRQEPRLRPTLPRSTLAKNPLKNVADRHPL
jgi:transposase